MEPLPGGRRDQIWQSDEGVHRPVGPWSKNVHSLLKQIRTYGFTAAPRFLRIDEQGREVLTYIPGIVGNDFTSEAVRSQDALLSAARLLNAYHEASSQAVLEFDHATTWQLPSQLPAEVICHGDFGPHNIVLDGHQAIGVIDFDVAHPGPRVWDVAYAIYKWAPITAPKNSENFGSLDEQIERARLFCEAYGLRHRGLMSEVICRRLAALVTFMRDMAAIGDQQIISNIADGHLALYIEDIDYIRTQSEKIDRGLREFITK